MFKNKITIVVSLFKHESFWNLDLPGAIKITHGFFVFYSPSKKAVTVSSFSGTDSGGAVSQGFPFVGGISIQFFSSGEQVDVSENRDTPKSSILIGFSIINHPFWGPVIFGNTQVDFFFESAGWMPTRYFWGLPISFFLLVEFSGHYHTSNRNSTISPVPLQWSLRTVSSGKRLSAKDFGAEVHICSSKPRWLGNHDRICATKINQWHMIEEVLHRLG